ncbi:RNA methyltransferase [Melissococcus plutonius]|uniref:rRNA methylase n=1 Tax=Melissococcus plutonius TaxID=33970 RepID=A0A2Z5Y240_9ENTE|nr:RNA methyltransferase [Melissococcus plutonius]BAL61980.1 rRNA methylase [Melissococcus plutonius DAT561]MCV2499408.1 RNA methyltransferase [Melissococcus plutonius]MCV2500640.1 RNA methyltransferase [Melissococcus plutonius]MCV2505084.1 RNA methyltransferase [Melissococcus plutonius]MCV2507991.1 RNA methyltransferase [Melissococcus plutonius]
MKEILSTKNILIKEWRKLQQKKYRQDQKKYIVEGFHLVEEAINTNQSIESILLTSKGKMEWEEWLLDKDFSQIIIVSEEVMHYLSRLPTPQGILAIIAMQEEREIKDIMVDGGWLLLDNIQDPGNVGTMIRTADAAGLAGVILGEGTADIYSTKTLRSMQGSNYHLPILHASLPAVLSQFQEKEIPVFGTEVTQRSVAYTQVKVPHTYGLMVGNEGQGINQSLLTQVDQVIHIPMKGASESLNVAVAAGILIFHFEQIKKG